MSDDRTDTGPAAPIAYERWCCHQGCERWGPFGKDKGRGASEFWCMEHLPADYWETTARGKTPTNA